MANRSKTLAYTLRKPPKPRVSETIKRELDAKAGEFVTSVFKPKHVQPAPADERFNYIVDISTKWYRNYFYFCATYRCPGPNAISPSFEVRFARLEYTGDQRFALAFMRHTGQWIENYPDLSLSECLAAIEEEPYFYP